MNRIGIYFKAALVMLLVFHSCKNPERKKLPDNFDYKTFRDSIKSAQQDTTGNSSNLLDSALFIPGIDSVEDLMIRMDTLLRRDIAVMEQIDTLLKVWKKTEKYTPEELEMIKENVNALDSFLVNRNAAERKGCREKDCLVYAEIIKSTQTLYLYLDAELIDSFPVSTGMKKYETPKLSVRPSGPLLKKYTSKKFPGGNYQGLGNMPYAVFIRGGYAIHGTTTGNFSKLGTKASHGCIRLHPVNARIFYELVKRLGIEYTWVTIKDTLQ
jgi:hypothetical protein